MNPHAYARRQSGKERRQHRMCKYCFNESVRHQGLCHECLQRPKEENRKHLAIINAKATLSDFLLQQSISAKNLKTIKGFCESEDGELRELASLVLMIGTQFPRKKKRYLRIRERDPKLYSQLRQNLLVGWLEYEDSYETEFDDGDHAGSQIEAEEFEFDCPLPDVPF